MKKTALILISGFMAVCASAQSADDALLFSKNDYEGTARTLAMGNAFTALGGDLGSIGINPAGSAVANYSQLTITPGISFSASTTQGVLPPNWNSGESPYFEKQMRSKMTRFSMPNLGITFNYNTHRSSGIKNVTVGFIVNQTADWNEDTYASGENNTTSFMASMAYWAEADGMTGNKLNAGNAFDLFPWQYVIGYGSGMIYTYGNNDGSFIGASEITDGDRIRVGGTLEQAYGRRVEGDKRDYLINVGANISDFIYIGANLGFTSINYSYCEYFKERAVDPSNFEIEFTGGEKIYFNDMIYRFDYRASGMGCYGKFGIIVTPGKGLRIGAAVQTPTINTINEDWQHGGETTYDDIEYNDLSPEGRSKYNMTSPLRANFGLAYAFKNFGVISADYEICDYGMMKYNTSGYDREYFEAVNEEIGDVFKASHTLRIGAEFKVVPELAVRAGYGLATSPEVKSSADVYVPFGFGYSDRAYQSQNVSLGLGYSSKSSFFADFAVRRTFVQDEYFMPYSDYIFDEEGYVAEGGFAPEIINKRGLWKVALTLGWRF